MLAWCATLALVSAGPPAPAVNSTPEAIKAAAARLYETAAQLQEEAGRLRVGIKSTALRPMEMALVAAADSAIAAAAAATAVATAADRTTYVTPAHPGAGDEATPDNGTAGSDMVPELRAAIDRCKAAQQELPDDASGPSGHLTCEPAGLVHGAPCLPENVLQRSDYAMCKRFRKDDEWPTFEPWLKRTPGLKTMADVEEALRGRTIVLIGASVVSQSWNAAQCSLRGIGAPAPRLRAWKRWGWANIARDGGGCNAALEQAKAEKGEHFLKHTKRFGELILETRCYESSPNFDKMLSTAEVVLLGYHIDHHHHNWEMYQQMVGWMLARLQNWTKEDRNRVVLVREHSPQHFRTAGGGYDAVKYNADLARYGKRWCQCKPLVGGGADHAGVLTERTRKMVEPYPDIHMVHGFYNSSRERWNMHIGAACGRRPPKFEGVITEKSLPAGRPCCDCTHWCYTPLFWDVAFFNPIHEALVRINKQRDAQRALATSDF